MILEIAMTAIVLCNNHNWTYSPRCNEPVKEMHITPTGNFYGTLENGIKWEQVRLTSEVMIFTMEDVKYAVYKSHVIYLD